MITERPRRRGRWILLLLLVGLTVCGAIFLRRGMPVEPAVADAGVEQMVDDYIDDLEALDTLIAEPMSRKNRRRYRKLPENDVLADAPTSDTE